MSAAGTFNYFSSGVAFNDKSNPPTRAKCTGGVEVGTKPSQLIQELSL